MKRPEKASERTVEEKIPLEKCRRAVARMNASRKKTVAYDSTVLRRLGR
jgi:hypothetical protein